MSSPPPPISKRRVPPPCWNPDETLVLVQAYAERWLSLNRGYLRSTDWDIVSSTVSASNPSAPKSSLQCRHKIEKLRIRYRSEKQRSLALSGCFVSSWHLFPFLDSINFGSSSNVSNNQTDDNTSKPKSTDVVGVRVRVAEDCNLVSKYRKIDGDGDVLGQDFGLKDGFRRNNRTGGFDGSFGVKLVSDGKLVNLASRAVDECESGFEYRNQGVGLKSYRKINDDKLSHVLDYGRVDGFPVKSLGDRISVTPPPGFKSKDSHPYSNYYNYGGYYGFGSGGGSGFSVKATDNNAFHMVNKLKSCDRVDVGYNDNAGFNGYASSSRFNFGKMNDGGGSVAVKMDSDPYEELASSVTSLTQRFMKIEEMKMEMAMETQKIRMEMEMKHSQMILDTQRHILDTFLSGLLDTKKKKKVKVECMSPNTRNGDGV